MRYKSLGKSGIKVSAVGLGFWQAGGRSWESPGSKWVVKVVEEGIGKGINFLDTAEVYGWGRSEQALGEALRYLGIRDSVFVASKVGGFRTSVHSVLKGVEGINRRLGRSVDLIQAHWPPPAWVSVCKVVRALENAVASGLCHYYGLSNYPRKLLMEALEYVKRFEPISNQVHYNLAYRTPEIGLHPYMRKVGMALIAWSPLAKGALAGLKKAKDPAQKRDKVFRKAARDEDLQSVLSNIAGKHSATKAQIALSWLISKGAIPIPGTRKPARVKEYAKAADIVLTNNDLQMLENATNKYLKMWGKEYREFHYLRYVPAFMQHVYIIFSKGA